jgi:oxaloacetate decarboxylase alpha subunit
MNLLAPERYANVPDEVVRMVLGQFGEPAAPPDPDVLERILSQPRARELREVEPLSLAGARERFGADIADEELLLRLTMPAEQVDAMLSGAAADDDEPARPVGDRRHSPVVTLLRELEARPSLREVEVRTGEELLRWRRGAR